MSAYCKQLSAVTHSQKTKSNKVDSSHSFCIFILGLSIRARSCAGWCMQRQSLTSLCSALAVQTKTDKNRENPTDRHLVPFPTPCKPPSRHQIPCTHSINHFLAGSILLACYRICVFVLPLVILSCGHVLAVSMTLPVITECDGHGNTS